MKKLLGPILAASLAAPGCAPDPFFRRIPTIKGSDCETKECFIQQAFGAKKEGLQETGAYVSCENGDVSEEEILQKSRRRYAELHGCTLNPNERLFTERVGSHHASSHSTFSPPTESGFTCAFVFDHPETPACKKK